MPSKKVYKTIFRITLSIIVFCIVFLILIWQNVYLIRSISMENTLFDGDLILISRINNINSNSLKTGFNLTPLNTENIKKNEIILYQNYDKSKNQNKILVKRCIAIPGDTLIINNGIIIINKHRFSTNAFIKQNYLVHFKKDLPYFSEFENKDIYYKITGIDENQTFKLNLLEKDIPKIRKFNSVESIRVDKSNQNDNSFFQFKKWTYKDLGPLIIPKKGRIISLDTANIKIYKHIICEHENNDLTIQGNQIFINNQNTKQYTFQNDYYFAMGDNRDFSNDSRKYGFIPLNKIIGKVKYFIFSSNRYDK